MDIVFQIYQKLNLLRKWKYRKDENHNSDGLACDYLDCKERVPINFNYF